MRFGRVSGADLFCSPNCKTVYERKNAEIAAQLQEHGFQQDKANPDLFTKEGVSISRTYVRKNTLAQGLSVHSAAVQYHARTSSVAAAPSGK